MYFPVAVLAIISGLFFCTISLVRPISITFHVFRVLKRCKNVAHEIDRQCSTVKIAESKSYGFIWFGLVCIVPHSRSHVEVLPVCAFHLSIALNVFRVFLVGIRIATGYKT